MWSGLGIAFEQANLTGGKTRPLQWRSLTPSQPAKGGQAASPTYSIHTHARTRTHVNNNDKVKEEGKKSCTAHVAPRPAFRIPCLPSKSPELLFLPSSFDSYPSMGTTPPAYCLVGLFSAVN